MSALPKWSGPILFSVDPGVTGAVVVIDLRGGELIAVEDLPIDRAPKAGGGVSTRLSAAAFGAFVRDWVEAAAPHKAEAVFERVHAMPTSGASAMLSFGRSAGIVEGVLGALSVPYQEVSNAVWSRAVGLPKKGPDEDKRAKKDAARARAMRLWPGSASFFARKKDDGRADAALMGWAVWRTLGTLHGARPAALSANEAAPPDELLQLMLTGPAGRDAGD